MDIYISVVLTCIFILEAFQAYRAAERRRTIKELAMPILAAIAEAVDKATKGEKQ